MTATTQVSENEVIQNLRKVSEARGMKFYFDPPRDVVPAFLGDFQPDALVVGPSGGIVIEVMARRTLATKPPPSDIAALVSRQKGWEFRAIFLNPSNDREPIINKPEPGQVAASLEELGALVTQGHRAAALVLAFGTLESLARLAMVNGERSSARSPAAAIQALAEQGYLENDDADRLRDLVELRNQVVHGDLSVDVQTKQVENVLRTLQQVAADVVAG